MVAFRKWFPVLAMLSLLLSLATSASAQGITCNANSGVPPVVRAEGFTELTGDIVLSCTGGNPAAGVQLMNFQIFLNTNITSRLVSGLSEALLMIDEPGALIPTTATPNPICLAPDAISNSLAVVCVPPGFAVQSGFYNTFRATKAAVGENSVVWAGVPIVAPGTFTRTIRITNVRAAAANLGVSSTLIPTQIVTVVSASPANALSINNPQQPVGLIQPGLQFDVRACNGGATGSAQSFVQCNAQNADLFNNPASTSTFGAQFGVRFREGFQTAFKTQIDPGQATSVPGIVYNSESGFVRPEIATGTVGLADHGTRLAARFNNVPAGVRIFVSASNVTAAGNTDIGTTYTTATLITTDLSGAGGTSGGTIIPASAVNSLNCAASTAIASQTAAEVPIVSGTGLAVWQITAESDTLIDTAFFLVSVAYAANTANNLPGLGQSTVTGNFAPFYAAGSSLLPDRMGTLPIPRFLDSPVSRNDFIINTCQTNLLFPFVTNQAGFDTGLAISNTSRDPFSSASGRVQAGRCTLNFYGGTAGGGAAPAAKTTNANVEAGNQLLYVLSSGGNLGLDAAAGFQGYIIAQCQFQYAHGFAFITDGPIGQARVAEGYLALIMDAAVGTRTGASSESLAH